jgi:hypothetical protein
MAAEPKWSDGFARRVVAYALTGDLFTRLPGAFTPDLFNPEAKSPRATIAKAICDYREEFGKVPSADSLDQLLFDADDSVREEWQAVQEMPDEEDQEFILSQVRAWVEYKRLEIALTEAGLALDAKGADGVSEAREALAKAESVTLADDRRRVLGFMKDSEARLALWATGEEMGERIPTGLPALDTVLNGGPTRKESWYFLAPPKGAKTMSLLRVARGAALRGYGVYMATFEMQAIRMLLRADRMASRQSKEELQANQARLRAVFDGMRSIGSGDIYVQEQPTQHKGSVAAVAREVEKLRREGKKIDVVIFDYLNIMGSKVNEREKRFELAAISREMSELAKSLGVLVWSAALVNRKAVEKEVITKTDIAEAFEVIAVCDGTVSICAPPGLVQNNARRYFVAAAREEADAVMAGDYSVDFPRMYMAPMDSAQADRWIAAARQQRRGLGRQEGEGEQRPE